jgi:hypothetical protein
VSSRVIDAPDDVGSRVDFPASSSFFLSRKNAGSAPFPSPPELDKFVVFYAARWYNKGESKWKREELP